MEKPLQIIALVLFSITGYGQDTSKVTGQRIAARLKESIDFANLIRLNAKNAEVLDLRPLGSKASTSKSNVDFTKMIADAEKKTQEDLKQMIKFDAGSLDLTFSLSNAFVGIATSMRILEPKEANKVNLAVIQANNSWKYITGGVAAAGTALTAFQLIKNSSNINPKTALTVNMASLVPLLINSFRKSGGTQNNEAASTEINQAISSAATYAYQKGQRLAVHSFLSVEVNKVSGNLNSLQSQSSSIFANIQQAKTDVEISTMATQLIALIDDTDTFFSSTILNMQAAIKDHSTIELYDKNTQTQLSSLSTQIAKSITSWNNMKGEFKKHQNLINTAVDTFP